MRTNKIAKVIQKTTINKKASDVTYWRTKTYAERLAALEDIRREYNSWKYSDAEQRFQRVYRIIEPEQG